MNTALITAADRFLDALRVYFNEGIDQQFQEAAYALGRGHTWAVEEVPAGLTINGDPLTERTWTPVPATSNPQQALRDLVERHSREALGADWAALEQDTAYAALPAEAQAEFEAAVARVLDVHSKQSPGMYGSWNATPGANTYGEWIETARAVLYRAAVDNPARRDVTDAQQQLAVVQADQSDTTTALHNAIAATDLDAIGKLRPIVAIEAPAKVDQARQALLQAEADAATIDVAPFVDRQARVEKAAADAARAVEKARAALAAAEARRFAADTLVPYTTAATISAQQTAEAAVIARDTHAADLKTEQVRRVRTFAGV